MREVVDGELVFGEEAERRRLTVEEIWPSRGGGVWTVGRGLLSVCSNGAVKTGLVGDWTTARCGHCHSGQWKGGTTVGMRSEWVAVQRGCA
jgi:hypothetical protein